MLDTSQAATLQRPGRVRSGMSWQMSCHSIDFRTSESIGPTLYKLSMISRSECFSSLCFGGFCAIQESTVVEDLSSIQHCRYSWWAFGRFLERRLWLVELGTRESAIKLGVIISQSSFISPKLMTHRACIAVSTAWSCSLTAWFLGN